MSASAYVRALLVLIATLTLTALLTSLLSLSLLFLIPNSKSETEIGAALFLAAALFEIVLLQHFSKIFLYEKADLADLQALGGVRLGGHIESIFSGKGASWPFAKLSVSREAIRLQTPFGNYLWEKCDRFLIVRRIATAAWEIETKNVEAASIVFSSLPWDAIRIDRKLKELRYEP